MRRPAPAPAPLRACGWRSCRPGPAAARKGCGGRAGGAGAAGGTRWSRGSGRLSGQLEGGDVSLCSPHPAARPSPPAPPGSPPFPLRLLSRLPSAPRLCVLSFPSAPGPSRTAHPGEGRPLGPTAAASAAPNAPASAGAPGCAAPASPHPSPPARRR